MEQIINGVDVECCYAENKTMKDGLYCFWEGGSCEDNPECYYKQLRRKEEECNTYKQALDEIEKIINKLDDSWECVYGDCDCDNCSDLEEDTVCSYKIKKTILQIVQKAKGE